MKNSIELIRTLAIRYFDGTSSLDEERLLAKLIAEQSDLPSDLKPLRLMLGGLNQIRVSEIAPHRHRTMRLQLQTIVSACASIAAAVVVGIAIIAPQSLKPESEDILCYINGEPITDINIVMEQAKYLDNLAELDETINAIDMLIN